MFKYNHFWHFWFQLNNRNYFNIFITSLLISLGLSPIAFFIPVVWFVVVIQPIITFASITLLTQISNFFYNKQNKTLRALKANSNNPLLSEQINYYIDRRVVCPKELLLGTTIVLPPSIASDPKAPLLLLHKADLHLLLNSTTFNRNAGYLAKGASKELYMKKLSVNDGLSEIAAREMAEIMGLGNLIPSNTIKELTDPENQIPTNNKISSHELILSREELNQLSAPLENQKAVDPIKVQNAVAKFILNLKTAVLRSRAKTGSFELLYIQHFLSNAKSGLQIYSDLLSNNNMPLNLELLRKIDLSSFQENFLLCLILGSQDANPGNTLFTVKHNDTVHLHSIDHERIMPEDNFNITKMIPLSNQVRIEEKPIKNVFPIRLWLAGLPHANIPFKREIIQKILDCLNPTRLLSYHHYKKLFSPAAVGAQLDRVLLIRKSFEDEMSNKEVTLTPKKLFLKFIDNHPTYTFLKKDTKLSEFHIFMFLGQIPEETDWSLFRHPLQYFAILKKIFAAIENQGKHLPPFYNLQLTSSFAHSLFYNLIKSSEETEQNPTIRKNIDSLASV